MLGGAAGGVGILGALRIVVDADTSKAQKVLQTFGGRAQLIGAAVGGALGGAGVAALKMGDQYDAAMDTIRIGTGATGKTLDAIEEQFKAVSGRVTEDIGIVGTVVAQLNTRMGETGDVLGKMGESVIDIARLTGTDYTAAVDGLTEAYRAWGVSGMDTIHMNDVLLRAYQMTGVSLQTLTDGLTKNGAVLRAAGFTYGQSAALIGTLGQAGIDLTTVIGPLRKSLASLAKEGKAPAEALQGILDAIKDAPDDVKATQLAIETFGAKGAVMAQLIREGRLEVDDLFQTIENGGDTVQGLSDETRDAADGIKELMNRVTTAVGPITAGFAGIADAMGNAIFLLPALTAGIGKLVGKMLSGPRAKAAAAAAGAVIGRIYQAGIAAAKVAGGALAAVFHGIAGSPVGKAAAVAGGVIGGVFSTAMGTAIAAGTAIRNALVGLLSGTGLVSAATAGGLVVGAAFVAAAAGVILAWNLKEDIERKTREGAAALTDQTKRFLESAPSREEVDKALYGIAHAGEKMGLIERAYYEANVQGVKTISDQQYTAIRLYGEAIDKGMSHADALAAAGFAEVKQTVATGAAEVKQTVAAATATVPVPVIKLGQRIRDAAPGISSAWDAVTNALAKGPELMSFRKRMSTINRAVALQRRRLTKAVRIGDSVGASDAMLRLTEARKARRELLRTQEQTMADAGELLGRLKAQHRRARGSAKSAERDVAKSGRRAARRAERDAAKAAKQMPTKLAQSEPETATAAQGVADAAAAPMKDVAADAQTYGTHLGQRFAAGISSQAVTAGNAAAALARAVRDHIAFSNPPKKGPLHFIRQWGPHMVIEWIKPIRRTGVKHAKGMGKALAEAIYPKRLRWSSRDYLRELRDMDKAGKSLTARQARILDRFRKRRRSFAEEYREKHGGGGGGGGAGGVSRTRVARMDVGRMRVDGVIVRGGKGGGDVHIHAGNVVATDRSLDQLLRKAERRQKMKRRNRHETANPARSYR